MFNCESDGFEAVVYGAFDGVTTWVNNAYLNLGPLHQQVVSAHEERHLRLQKGTPWGALLMLTALSGDQRAAHLADACRRTHEAYATYLSAAHVPGGLDTLDGNAAYLGYWLSAAELAEPFGAAERNAVLEYLFHLLMSPAALSEASLGSDHAALLDHSPDMRLAVLTELLREDPQAVASIAAAVAQASSVDEAQDRIAAIMDGLGLSTQATREQLTHAERLMDEFNATSKTHRVTISERHRRTALADQLEYQEHEVLVVQRDRARLRLWAPPERAPDAPHPLVGFVTDDQDLGPHIWGTLLSRSVIERQFELEEPIESSRVWGLLAIDRRGDPPVALLWPLPDAPRTVTEKFADAGIQSVVMTTLSTLNDPDSRISFSPSTPVFVLVDLPVLPVLRGLGDETEPVRWVHAQVGGDRHLNLFVLTLAGPDPMYFVIVRSEHTAAATAEWLTREPGFVHDATVGSEVHPHLAALARHAAGTFATFETPAQFAG